MMNLVVYGFLFLGIFFSLVGNVGVLRFPDVYTRLQAATKCAVTGVVSILFACMFLNGISPAGGRIMVITLFLLATGPVTSHIIARYAWQKGILPRVGRRKKGSS